MDTSPLNDISPLQSRKFVTVSQTVYYKQLSAFITAVSKDFAENELMINDDNKAYIIEALREKCEDIFPRIIMPDLGEFTFSLQSDLPENILQIILILREVFQSYNLV